MEKLFDSKVMLRLWVKVKSGWSDDERSLTKLGYSEREIAKVRKALSGEILTTDAYIKRALQLLLK